MSKNASLNFINNLTNDIELLEELISKNKLETFDRIGAEQEFCIVDNNFRANPINNILLKKLNSKDFVTEIAKFNMELNIKPIDINKNCLEQLENVLLKKMRLASQKAKDLDSEIIMTGILPTVRKYDLRFENITNNKRYFELCESINTIRGDEYKLRIRGLDELVFQHDSPLVEGCNTGYQFHLQIGPKDFTKMYNISQLIAAPVLAISANSPMLFGKRLWNETRIAVFQQSTDTRIIGNYHPGTLPRVTFGNEWVNESIIEIFKEDIIRYKILLNKLTKSKGKEKNPKMKALSLHNSTVYRWNRPCYGIYKGKPSLRIESRMFPAGPTIIDQVSNSAFWLGLMTFYKYNLDKLKGLHFSQNVMLKLISKGLLREEAYAIVQKNAMKTWKDVNNKSGNSFYFYLTKDKELTNLISKKELKTIFNNNTYIKNIDVIYNKVFKKKAPLVWRRSFYI